MGKEWFSFQVPSGSAGPDCRSEPGLSRAHLGYGHLLRMLLSHRDAHPQQTLAPSCSCHPQMEPGTRHSVIVPAPRQFGVSRCSGGCGCCGGAGCPSLGVQDRVAGPPDVPAPQAMHMSSEEGNYHPKDCEGGSSGLVLSPGWAPIDMQTVSPCPAGTYRHGKCCHGAHHRPL